MPSPSLHTHRLIGGMAVIALVILIGPLLKQHSSQQLLSQGTSGSCPSGMPQCTDFGCRTENANCRAPRNCCDMFGNITQKLPCCSPSFACSDDYICAPDGSGGLEGGPPSPPSIIPCSSDDDCHDPDPCTIDRCLSGMCTHEPNSTDTDNDGTLDCVDQCPSDPVKTEPEECGCNQEESFGCGASGSPPPPPPSPSPAPDPSPSPAPSPSPSPLPPSPTTGTASRAPRPSSLPTTNDCAKCTNVRDVCTQSEKFTYIHESKTLCACFDPGTYQEGWLLCLWGEKSPPPPASSRPLLPPPPLLKPTARSSAITSSHSSSSAFSSVFSLPPLCGDGIVQPPKEECDDGRTNSYAPNACRPYCQKAWCGDGITDTASEDCDAGAVCIGGLLDGPQCAGFGCVRGDPNCISPEACEKGGGTCDFVGDSTCTLYCASRKIASSALSSSSAPLGLMQFFQKACLRCGDGWFNVCDQQECESFGPCSYQSVVGSFLGTCAIDKPGV